MPLLGRLLHKLHRLRLIRTHHHIEILPPRVRQELLLALPAQFRLRHPGREERQRAAPVRQDDLHAREIPHRITDEQMHRRARRLVREVDHGPRQERVRHGARVGRVEVWVQQHDGPAARELGP